MSLGLNKSTSSVLSFSESTIMACFEVLSGDPALGPADSLRSREGSILDTGSCGPRFSVKVETRVLVHEGSGFDGDVRKPSSANQSFFCAALEATIVCDFDS